MSDVPPTSGPPPSADVHQRLSAALGPNYAVRRLLGRGGFADVFEVWDAELERRLAVKVLRPDIAWTAGMLERFRQEAKAVARLAHPNILPIHFVAETAGLVYYAMPFVEGLSLGALLRDEGALDPDEAVRLTRPLLDALQHAHERGLVHRDIKPDNVMLDSTTGRVLLMDFGIAKRLDIGPGHTLTGYVVGSPRYMSPEQALGQRDIDARADVYSMGAMLFQMVTGAPPFEGETSQEIVGKHIGEPAPVPSDVNAQVPRWLSAVILRCLAKNPDERFPSMERMAQALDRGPPRAAPQPAESSSPGVGSDEPTAVMRLAGRRASRWTTWRERIGRRAADARWWIIGFIAVAALAAAVVLVARPRLVVENRLVEPIRVTLPGGAEETIAPDGRLRRRLPRGASLLAHWYLVRPTTSAGVAMGVEVQGVIATDRPRGRVTHVADARPADGAYFAPLITNGTDRPLVVTVNAGLDGARSCGCVVPPGASRARIGYYPLFRNSTVRVEDARGWSAMFPDVGPRVDRASGVVGLRFEVADLQPPGAR